MSGEAQSGPAQSRPTVSNETGPSETLGAQDYDVDVVQISDFRLPGGTTSSVAEEVRVQSRAGISTALVHIAGSVTNYPLGWSEHIRRVVGLPHVQLATPHARLRARLAVVRHPTVIQTTRSRLEGIEADQVIVVANHAAVDAAGKHHYDIAATDAKVREIFGVAPVWAPVGPVVRGTMEQQTDRIPFRREDWFNIFDVSDELAPRTGFLADVPVLGRHSRPQPGKWPNRGRDILAAYPDSEEYQVRVLGGAAVAEKHLGHVPSRWEVIPFGGEEPMEFLKRIDFWVYMHHPHLKEAFGRAAMEALAAGCVAILPPYMQELFGDAALYGTPPQVRGIVDERWRHPEVFLEQSRKAVEFASRFSAQMHVERLEALGVTAPVEPGAGSAAGTVPPAPARAPRGPGVVLLSGEHSPEQLRECAQLLSADPELTAVVMADRPGEGLPEGRTVYLPSARRMNLEPALWEEHAAGRLTRLLNMLQPVRVLYSGPPPDPAITRVLLGTPAHKTWIRHVNGTAEPVPGPGEEPVHAAVVPRDPALGSAERHVSAEQHFQVVVDAEPGLLPRIWAPGSAAGPASEEAAV